jgi:hypothetical protein
LWVTGGLGALIVLGVAGGLIFYLLRQKGSPLFVKRKQPLATVSSSDASPPPLVEGRPDE